MRNYEKVDKAIYVRNSVLVDSVKLLEEHKKSLAALFGDAAIKDVFEGTSVYIEFDNACVMYDSYKREIHVPCNASLNDTARVYAYRLYDSIVDNPAKIDEKNVLDTIVSEEKDKYSSDIAKDEVFFKCLWDIINKGWPNESRKSELGKLFGWQDLKVDYLKIMSNAMMKLTYNKNLSYYVSIHNEDGKILKAIKIKGHNRSKIKDIAMSEVKHCIADADVRGVVVNDECTKYKIISKDGNVIFAAIGIAGDKMIFDCEC